MFKCTDNAGQVSFQDRPCAKDETMKEIKLEKSQESSATPNKKELIEILAKAYGKKLDPNDPKMLQAAEAFLVTNAGKAYAFTKVYGVSLEFCPNNQSLINAMNTYKRKAKNSIALGKIYYRDGYDLQLGQKRFKHTGQQLTKGLDDMLVGLRKEHKRDPKGKCKESIQALKSLAMVYSG
ncbi:DUF4124 domain-containing protein [Alkalimarinus alittae]|nr:DUF4124 domain-containing protein [Alkalimarinus alittae]